MKTALLLGSVLWMAAALISLALWPLSPPDHHGTAGIIVAVTVIVSAVAFALAMRSSRIRWTFSWFLVTSYWAVIGIVILQWLAGGVGAPYERLLLLPVVFVAVLHPLRRIVPFLVFVALVLAAPVIYDGWNSDLVAGSATGFVLWCALAFAGSRMMSGIRGQRLTLRRDEASAREEARVDELTGIGNRRAFEEALENEMARARRMKVPLGMAMGDISNFKQINDSFGHLEGDICLRQVAQAISSEMRIPDQCYRWGGDEFALLLPGTGAEGSSQLAERLANKVSVVVTRPDAEPVWIRFGIAELDDEMDGNALVEAADLALLGTKSKTG